MAYLGNAPVVGDSTNSFRLLDDIASFTLTFDATDTSVVSISGDTLSFTNHRFVTGQKVTYTDGGGTAIGGLTDGTSYFIIKVDQSTIKLATNASNAASSTAIDLTSGAAGTSHTLKVAFDGVNTKFKATHSSGTKANISRAGQISLSINGVIQQPQDTSNPTVGYGVEPDSTIVFSTAPVATDKVFGTFIGEVAASFDITDNTVDNFTGDGSTTIFNLSREVPSSQDVLVTLDGVTQHPSDASTTRSYSVINQALTFVSAPATGVAIQARHIGFAGATTSEVTGFYGRTGNVALKSTDDISVQNISGVGATFTSNVNIEGVLTYEDVTNVDSIGIITARAGVLVGSGITLSKDGDIFATGVTTSTTFVGDLTGDVTGAATQITVAGETSDTTCFPVFVTTSTGNQAPKTRGTLTFNSSSGALGAPSFVGGTISGTTGTFTGDVDIADKLVHTGDTDTFLEFGTNAVMFDTAGSERLRINSSGLLLVGTTADVAGGATNSKIQIRGTSYDTSLAIVANRTNAGGGNISFSKSRAASQGDATVVQSGDTLGSIVWYGADGTDLNTAAAQLDVQVDTTPGSNDMPGRFVFRTTSDGAASPTERFRIASDGETLVKGDSNPCLSVDRGSANTTNINIKYNGSTRAQLSAASAAFEISAVGASAPMELFTNGNERLRITTGGVVNIGGNYSQTTFPFQLTGNGGGDAASMSIKNEGSHPAKLHLQSGHGNWSVCNSASVADAFEIRDESASALRMLINSSGYVAINRTTPSHYLDVDGTSLFRNRLYFSTGALKATPFGVNVTYDTGISVNAGGYGGSMLCLCSRQYNAGTGTQAALYFLHFYYDGNHQPVKHYLGGSNDFATFGKSGSNTLTVAMGASNNMFTVIESSVS